MFELTLLADAALAEAASDALLDEHDALSVSVEDADEGTTAERPLFGEPGLSSAPAGWERSTVKVLFADPEAATRAAAAVVARFGSALQSVSIAPVADADWVRRTQAQFESTEITRGFWVVPTWHPVPAAARRVIRLDPGMAFGTGTHPTTRMCLRWIARRAADTDGAIGGRALDYGCGSGILAIALALHGVPEVEAVDIDPAAVAATAANAVANRVTVRHGEPESVSGRYTLVLSNILATPLKLLAPLLCSLLDKSRGELVLAGILERQTDDLLAAYRPWIRLAVSDCDEGWVLLTGRSVAGSHGMIPS